MLLFTYILTANNVIKYINEQFFKLFLFKYNLFLY